MIKRNQLPTAERLRELLKYNPETGLLVWNVNRTCIKIGTPITRQLAGGHICVNIDGLPYLAHRVIWKMVTGRDPENDIDHEDTTPSNNIWTNLREATHTQNMANRKKPSTNTSGVKGVSFHRAKRKWCAGLVSNHQTYHVGYFVDIASAEAAINAARIRIHGEFARAE